LVFIMDDDKYLVGPVGEHLRSFEDASVAAVSLQPRRWWRLRIEGAIHRPMGSYAVILRRSVLVDNGLKLRPVRGVFPHKIAEPGAKVQEGFDTADFANLRLLELGYRVITLEGLGPIAGYDGMTAPRLLVEVAGAPYVRRALERCEHAREGSVNGSVFRGLYCAASFEEVFEKTFGEAPLFRTGINRDELREMVRKHAKLDREQKRDLLGYFDSKDEVCEALLRAGR